VKRALWLLLVVSLCGVLQLSRGVFVESERLFGFSAGVVKRHLRDVLVAGKKLKTMSIKPTEKRKRKVTFSTRLGV